MKVTGDLISVRLKRTGRADVNEVGMRDFLGSSLDVGQEKSFKLIIENGNTHSLTIKVLLENLQNKKPVIVKWEKEKSTEKVEDKPTPLPNIQMRIEPREINEPKFVILLENFGERISKKKIQNI
ncbi:MAG: hypothetical protein ACYC2U_02550 [Candidatus Amoebophilus sp.]